MEVQLTAREKELLCEVLEAYLAHIQAEIVRTSDYHWRKQLHDREYRVKVLYGTLCAAPVLPPEEAGETRGRTGESASAAERREPLTV
ncbi:MAG: hypothetical protein ACM3S1_01410 [Hyphomicrobiales bacterium]